MKRFFGGSSDKSSKGSSSRLPIRPARSNTSSVATPVQRRQVDYSDVNREIWNHFNGESSSFRSDGNAVFFDGHVVWQGLTREEMEGYVRYGGYMARPVGYRQSAAFTLVLPHEKKQRQDLRLDAIPYHQVYQPVRVYAGLSPALQQLWNHPLHAIGFRLDGPYRPRVSTRGGHVDEGSTVPLQ